jgi:hypothetical protein
MVASHVTVSQWLGNDFRPRNNCSCQMHKAKKSSDVRVPNMYRMHLKKRKLCVGHTGTDGPTEVALSARPMTVTTPAAAAPYKGPAAAILSTWLRFLRMPLMPVMAPKLPMMPRPAGIKMGGASFTPSLLAAFQCPDSCAAACAQFLTPSHHISSPLCSKTMLLMLAAQAMTWL